VNLFFETSGQAWRFLCVVPLGFVAALCLDAQSSGVLRVLADVVLLMAVGIGTLVVIVFCGDARTRLYHLLALVTGAQLYLQGIGKIVRLIRLRQELRARAQN
jgi:uncharacterized membrane protein